MPNALTSLFSTIGSYKRIIGDAVKNPVNAIQQLVGNADDGARRLNELTGEAAKETPFSNGPATQRLASLLSESYQPGAMGATVWHGPNVKNNLNADYLKDLISSQRYLDRDIVAQKIRNKDFTVSVTPKFNIDGDSVRAIQDGHHALEAAIRSGNKPKFITNSATDSDRVQLLNDGNIDGYLEAAYHDSPWYSFASKRDLF